ncbi:bifunctional diaminohydroxyphosphoribosylaminopyrimidine deaminase/5-amino-6-(5-phosphoribosylamino)uracil reductase RibD [Paenibacillus sp. NEAU-GSW1]|uniref:bifunctional diaminohydroxyphosphoribosylaminopyrimidine deaminase/5-amino-6-(5-phosphoribosylamino)uracil reductase RibD n=1 Tax=Paenibacillus sp. NEAU-GSW1 TaxID=2682486 RepID=UPI0012E180F1|nr:bifunctional diaminohydroxyphosphoribosylaminopyrimidine deaminase/5-amino-6-(5-phosphoribosylamino)uracil reductase RibD [Paenibacillus sp. NEAU-GSW1]MUT65537.1 bifunctional diaminohydroxyphosphoribosylaminopyrimidine deaminase/5-amino-6-(5-phosphoribosylamino)uracil reductase RibD [Paenibacillus sp. NEAU-GSW1]
MEVLNDAYYMSLALEMAAKAAGQTGINPVVGCVVVKEGRIIGIGTHLKRGTGHAEVHALKMAGDEAEGATVYVTLEPCSHYGKTPPCCERIIEAKAARVVVATTDPNPQVAGRGIERIREAGIEVEVGLMEAQSRSMNEKFNKYITTKRPFVTLKTASTLDGKIASRTGDSRWVTGAAAREQVHTLRHQHEAIMVGIGTVLADDPQLTTRADVPAIHPVRVIIDSKLKLPEQARVVTDRTVRTIVVTTEQADHAKADKLIAAGVEVIRAGKGDQVDLAEAMRMLGELEIGSILLEGGGKLNGAMLEAGLIDKIIIYMATKIIGGLQAPGTFTFDGFEKMSQAIALERVAVEMAGDDISIAGYPVYE